MKTSAKYGGRHGVTHFVVPKKKGAHSPFTNKGVTGRLFLSALAEAVTVTVVGAEKTVTSASVKLSKQGPSEKAYRGRRSKPVFSVGTKTKTGTFRILERLERALAVAEPSKPISRLVGGPINSVDSVPAQPFTVGARGVALLRGREQLETLLTEAGGAFTQEQVQTMLYRVSRQAVDKRVREGSLLAVPGPSGARRYPVCQFHKDGSLLKGLKDVQAALPVRGPWSAFLFLMQQHDGLGGRKPLDALREGELALVVAAAERLGAQGS